MSACWQPEYVPLNGCPMCGRDFTSQDAFDRHRVGRHEPLERRCLSLAEMAEVGLHVMTPEEMSRSQYASRARFGVVLVHDPQAAERVRRRFGDEWVKQTT
jgi:hypothetical protein